MRFWSIFKQFILNNEKVMFSKKNSKSIKKYLHLKNIYLSPKSQNLMKKTNEDDYKGKSKYVFFADRYATKNKLKKEFKFLFNELPLKINISLIRRKKKIIFEEGKQKSGMKRKGLTTLYKKVIFTLPPERKLQIPLFNEQDSTKETK